jgi:predicted  nucleic acid-binding Zn-ribbon protein
MNKLDSAIRAFNDALDRLEEASRARDVRTAPPSAALQQEIAVQLRSLKEDRARLAEELTRLNVEKVALEGFTDEVAGRLEGAIREIRAVLAH